LGATYMNNGKPQKNQRIRRIAGLVFLGIAVGLLANQMLSFLRHEVTIEINLSPDLVRDLDGLELRVTEAGSNSAAVSLTRYFFDRYHRPSTILTHVLNVINGRYEIHFTMEKNTDQPPASVTRPLEVNGAMHVSYNLP
jgi:hypothetical protein